MVAGARAHPFVVASVLAYALTPLVNWIDDLGRGRIPRLLAVLVVELLFIFVLVGIFLLMIPIFAKELPLMREQLPWCWRSVNSGGQALAAAVWHSPVVGCCQRQIILPVSISTRMRKTR
ncbi:AI-2E family transporter [Candidatus Aalborgicola defluviihabitans]|uniref:AI-2E family transporter n=1 Tax=Candidatus Aalborgicola defluviihabitans TaxID=3386187 RepID=UPI0039B95FF7